MRTLVWCLDTLDDPGRRDEAGMTERIGMLEAD
jgi:hypothetical protein